MIPVTSTLNAFVKQSWAGLRAMLVFTALFGLLYPAVVWGVGRVVAPDQSAGSLGDVLHEPVAVSFLLGETEQELEVERLEWKEVARRSCHVTGRL